MQVEHQAPPSREQRPRSWSPEERHRLDATNEKYSTPLFANEELVERIRAGFTLWKAQWMQSRRPMLRVLDTVADGAAIADTRRIAKERMTAISREQDAVLRHFERPRPRAPLDGALKGHVEAFSNAISWWSTKVNY